MSFDILLPFNIPIKMLSMVRLWIAKESTFRDKIYRALFHLVIIELFMVLQLLYLTEVKDIIDFANFLSIFSTCVSFNAKSINLMFFMDEIVELLKIIQEHCIIIDETFKKHLIRVTNILKILLGTAFLTAIVGAFGSFITHELAYRMYVPHKENSIIFWLAVFYQDICTIVGSGKLKDNNLISFLITNVNSCGCNAGIDPCIFHDLRDRNVGRIV